LGAALLYAFELALGLLFLATIGFVAVLTLKRLTPQELSYKIAKRVAAPPLSLLPVVHDAPYKLLNGRISASHHPVLLNLPTSDGSGQACHPDVVYIPEGFGTSGWTYWMACTPYPYTASALENPEILASHDGLNWEVPEGLRNPVVAKPQGAGDHNSDPDMLFYQGQLWLFYRETLRSKTPKTSPDQNTIYLVKSTDGVHWSPPLAILQDNSGRQLVSPAVIHDGLSFSMWMVEVQHGRLTLVRRGSLDGENWSEPVLASLSGLESGRYPWHIDVAQDGDQLAAVLVSCTGLGGVASRIHYASSADGGLTWAARGFLLPLAYEFEGKLQYRASLRPIHSRGGDFELWYSAASATDMFSIAYLRLARSAETLVPALPAQKLPPKVAAAAAD
jgi:hypothetical protein